MATHDRARVHARARAGIAGLALAALAALPALALQDVFAPTAPDGHRGFGSTSELREVLEVLRGRRPDDRLFVERLDALIAELEATAAELTRSYALRGSRALVAVPEPGEVDPTVQAANADEADEGAPGRGRRARAPEEPPPPPLAEVHAAFRRAAEAPRELLLAEDERARAFADFYLDTRFRARLAVFESYAEELHEFRSGLAVLRAAADGWVVLNATELQNVLSRVDLSAAWLRAIAKDLEVLGGAAEPADPAAVTAFVGAAATRDEALGQAAFGAMQAVADERLERMLSALFTARFSDSPEARAQVEWRDRMRARAEPLRTEARHYLPGSEESGEVPPELAAKIADMRKTDRLRWAERRAIEGLGFDPLDEELVWIAAHCADFLWGDIQSRPLFDRFLALRGIRAHDDGTIRGRELDERELEALTIVQRGIPGLPGSLPAGGGNEGDARRDGE